MLSKQPTRIFYSIGPGDETNKGKRVQVIEKSHQNDHSFCHFIVFIPNTPQITLCKHWRSQEKNACTLSIRRRTNRPHDETAISYPSVSSSSTQCNCNNNKRHSQVIHKYKSYIPNPILSKPLPQPHLPSSINPTTSPPHPHPAHKTEYTPPYSAVPPAQPP